MTTQVLHNSPSFSHPSLNITGWLGSLRTKLNLWHERSKSRNRLAAMDAYGLKDIGLSRCDAWQEVNKPFWKE
jgi:uncharacterized protein YjiS (DUF1127 family)